MKYFCGLFSRTAERKFFFRISYDKRPILHFDEYDEEICRFILQKRTSVCIDPVGFPILNQQMHCVFFTFFYKHKRVSIGVTNIFESRFSVDLHVLRCPEQYLTVFRKYLSACMSPKFCGYCILRTNEQKLMKLFCSVAL